MSKEVPIIFTGRQGSFKEGDVDKLKTLGKATRSVENIIAWGQEDGLNLGTPVVDLDNNKVVLGSSTDNLEFEKINKNFRIGFEVTEEELEQISKYLYETLKRRKI